MIRSSTGSSLDHHFIVDVVILDLDARLFRVQNMWFGLNPWEIRRDAEPVADDLKAHIVLHLHNSGMCQCIEN
jgi:hypothetical protein